MRLQELQAQHERANPSFQRRMLLSCCGVLVAALLLPPAIQLVSYDPLPYKERLALSVFPLSGFVLACWIGFSWRPILFGYFLLLITEKGLRVVVTRPESAQPGSRMSVRSAEVGEFFLVTAKMYLTGFAMIAAIAYATHWVVCLLVRRTSQARFPLNLK
ncbi:MAG TPA: hypothetical protein VF384_11110 [Planctomycetota bacterium]